VGAKTSFRDLIVWQRAIDLVPRIYRITTGFPREELFALSSQLRRAAISIPANIAEGQARQHPKEFVQHLMIAKGSLAEVQTLLIIAHRLGYLSESSLLGFEEEELGAIRAPLVGLIGRLRR
jgi:four helix bundle protein